MRRSTSFGILLLGLVAGCGSGGGSTHDGGEDGRPSDAAEKGGTGGKASSAGGSGGKASSTGGAGGMAGATGGAGGMAGATGGAAGMAGATGGAAGATGGVGGTAGGAGAAAGGGGATGGMGGTAGATGGVGGTAGATNDGGGLDASPSDAGRADATGAAGAGGGTDGGTKSSAVCGTLLDLGTLPGDNTSMAAAINDLGEVVGVSEIIGQTENGFGWQAGTMSPVQTYGAFVGGTMYPPTAEPHAVNHSGQIAGMAFASLLGGFPKDYPAVWGGGLTGGATVVAPPGTWGVGKATAINDAAQVIGTVQVCTDQTVCDGAIKRMHAFLWQNGTGVDVGTLGGQATGTGPVFVTESSLTALNQSGQAAGWGLTASGATHAALWSGSQLQDLGTLGGSSSTAYAIDATGAVFGTSTAADGQGHAFRWTTAGMTDLGVIPSASNLAFNRVGAMIGQTGAGQGVFWKGGTTSSLTMTVGALNDAGEVAGTSSTGHLVVWQAGVTTDLGNLGGGSITPVAVDDAGRIIGSGSIAAGATHAFIFQPAVCP